MVPISNMEKLRHRVNLVTVIHDKRSHGTMGGGYILWGADCFITPPSLSFPQRGWVLGPNSYYSFACQQHKPEDSTIPSTELAKQVIEYARQLEMIV